MTVNIRKEVLVLWPALGGGAVAVRAGPRVPVLAGG